MDPEVSILMVSWNTRELTLAAIRSVFAETARVAFEVILVDNGSHDGTVDAVRKEFPDAVVIAESVNHGFAKGNNIAAGYARAPLLLLLNTDTIVLDGAIDRLVEFARKRPEARIWGGRTVFPDGRLNPTYAWRRITPWSSFCIATGLTARFRRFRAFNPEQVGLWGDGDELDVDIVSGCFFLVERALWEALEGFDTIFFMYGEEADFCARARAHGARPRISPDSVIVHFGGASASRSTDKLIYLFGARTGLADRHLPAFSGSIARQLIRFQAWWRALLFGAAAPFAPRLRPAAAQWHELWRRRQEWQDGPLQTAL